MADDDLHPIVQGVLVVLTILVSGFALWCTVLAFIGGTAPIFGWHFEGSVGAGLLWLFIIDPIVVTVGYWLATIIVLPLMAIFKR